MSINSRSLMIKYNKGLYSSQLTLKSKLVVFCLVELGRGCWEGEGRRRGERTMGN